MKILLGSRELFIVHVKFKVNYNIERNYDKKFTSSDNRQSPVQPLCTLI
jgi:hypothetical protein